jgi:hypothetical protein
VDRATIIANLQQTAIKLGRTRVTRAELRRETGITRDTVERQFGSFNALIKAAGLTDRYDFRRVPDSELLRALREAFAAEGPMISLKRVARLSGRGISTFVNRWGSWRAVVSAFVAWADREEPDFPHLDVLRQHYRLAPRPARSVSEETARRFGELLRFRTLEYAPTDESGVIYLFGILSADLGFVVDGLSKTFPDAEGKRRIGREWRRVRIEFELESRSFRVHGHDPEACDLIVCWEHNWPECPVEVLELRNEVRKLQECGQATALTARATAA